MTPEHELWLAVLLLAVEDLAAVGTRGGELRRSAAYSWVSSRNQSIGSFTWVCWQIGLDPGAVRERLLRFTPEDLRRRLRDRPKVPYVIATIINARLALAKQDSRPKKRLVRRGREFLELAL